MNKLKLRLNSRSFGTLSLRFSILRKHMPSMRFPGLPFCEKSLKLKEKSSTVEPSEVQPATSLLLKIPVFLPKKAVESIENKDDQDKIYQESKEPLPLGRCP